MEELRDTDREDQRARNLKIGARAASLLHELYTHETSSRSAMLEKLAEEMPVSGATISRWANGAEAIPVHHRQPLIDALRAFRWRVDPAWKLATAVSELAGINGSNFAEVDRFIENGEATIYKLVRLDGKGEINVGVLKISPLGEKPRWWHYAYSVKDEFTQQVGEKRFEGPVWALNKAVCAIAVGGAGDEEEPYIRTEYVWPAAHPKRYESFGISLSTYSRKGFPVASPFALVPMARWELIQESRDVMDNFQDVLRDKFKEMARKGFLELFGSA